MNEATIVVAIHIVVEVIVIVRVVLRPHREPASRIAWIVVIATLPLLGALAYMLFGEVNIGRRRIARMHKVTESLPPFTSTASEHEDRLEADVPLRYGHLFRVGASISGFNYVGGNTATLLPDPNSTIDAMVSDIDDARDHVHLHFYIWLADTNGCKIIEALKRAAARGVKCRAMVDGLGSRLMVKSDHWKQMRNAGVQVAVALSIGNPLLRPFVGRIDLRNHRKLVIIDGQITYCGSQNCADPEFRVKPKYAPWVDATIRFEGPIARQNQHLFVSDWMSYVDEDIVELLRTPVRTSQEGILAQAIGTGPTVRYSAMPEVFESLMHTARSELVITTPYYVPNESMQNALCATAFRGVSTTIILPARNDSWIVAAASRSYYAELLGAGVRIYEYVGGLLHTKSLTLDGEVTLIGSANMDRRSFELNYENSILFCDAELTGAVRQRQQAYIDGSNMITSDIVSNWSTTRRLWNNTIAMLGPVL